MIITLLVALFIFYIYKKTFRGVVYNRTYNMTLILMSLITALVIMTISSNVVLSLGMVGALSIVRFRTALKDPIDIAFMFWAISTGIATGAGIYPIAIIGSLFIGIVLLIMTRSKSKINTFLLIIHYEEDASEEVKRLVSKIKHKLISKNVNMDLYELTVELRIKSDNTGFISEFNAIKGVRDVSLVSYNGEYAS